MTELRLIRAPFGVLAGDPRRLLGTRILVSPSGACSLEGGPRPRVFDTLGDLARALFTPDGSPVTVAEIETWRARSIERDELPCRACRSVHGGPCG